MKFSIRDLLLVTVIVVLAVGWWVDHCQQESEMLRRASIALPDYGANWRYPIYVPPNSSARAPNPAQEVGTGGKVYHYHPFPMFDPICGNVLSSKLIRLFWETLSSNLYAKSCRQSR